MKNKNIAIIIFVVALLIIGIFLIFSLGWKREIKNLTNFSQNNFLLTKKEIKTAANNLPKNNERGLRFLFFGDIMLDRNVKIKIDKYGFDYLFSGTTTTSEMWNFNNYDLVSANLEGAVTDNGAHYSPSMSYDFAFAPTDIEQLKKYGFNFFNLANNHLADQGERGIIETRKNLDNLGFSYVGCTDRMVDECSTKVLDIAGKKIGMIGLSMVSGEFNHQRAEELVRKLASSTDLVIINIHWGEEYQHQFNKLQQQVGYELIDAGADIIIGHHPHVVQGMEIYQGKPIFYSLGNFIFDQYFSPDTQEGLGVGLNIGSQKTTIFLLPIGSQQSQLYLLAGDEKKEFLQKFVSWSNLGQNYAAEAVQGTFKIGL